MRVLIRNFREIVKMHTGDGKFSCHCGLGIFFLEKNEITILDEVQFDLLPRAPKFYFLFEIFISNTQQ